MPITRREFLSYSTLSLEVLSLPVLSKTHTSAAIPLQLWEFSKSSLRLQQHQLVTVIVQNQLPGPSSVH